MAYRVALVAGLLVAGAGLVFSAERALVHEGQLPLASGSLSYEDALSGSLQESEVLVAAPARLSTLAGATYSQLSLHEAVALANFVGGLEMATGGYFADLIATCEAQAAAAVIECPDTASISCEEYIEQQREYLRLRCLGNQDVPPDIDAGLAVMAELEGYLAVEAAALGSDVLARELELAADIRNNMSEGGVAPPYNDEGLVDNPWSVPGAGLGVTPGGPQDIGYLRSVVEQGFVPLPFHLAVDGLFAEHDLPIEGDQPCDQLLCVATAQGQAVPFGGQEVFHYVQVGFSSGLDAATFERSPLNLAVVVDRSGSMRDTTGFDVSKLEAVKAGLTLMVDRLTPADRLAVVAFDHEVNVLLDSTPVTDPEGITSIIAGLSPGGGTCIECGLHRGFSIVTDNSEPGERLDRVMLFTDALPNVGLTGEASFLGMATAYSELGVGLTTFGVGFNFGQELVVALSRVRGGNYFFLENFERVEEIFGVDFDYLVSPVAYDLHLDLTPVDGLVTTEVYGHDGLGDDGSLELDVPTLFMSRRHGAILVQIGADGGR
jgi:Ca-activated chloride channel family protein